MNTTAQTAARGRDDSKNTNPNAEPGASRSREEALERQWVERGLIAPGKLSEAHAGYQECLQRSVRPRTIQQTFLVGQAAWAMARLEHLPLVEEQARQIESWKAQTTWDEDRAAEAINLGERLLARPARVVGELRRTSQGAAWLIEQWRLLTIALEDNGAWNEEQLQRAGALLGVSIEHQPYDPRIRKLTTADACRALAESEVEWLTTYRRDVLEDWDARDRVMAIQGFMFDDSPDAWRLRRYEQSCYKTLRWAETMLEAIDTSSAGLLWTAPPEPKPATTPAQTAPRPDPDPVQPAASEAPKPEGVPERAAAEPAARPASPPAESSIAKRSQSTQTQFDKDVQEALRIATDPVAWSLTGLDDPAPSSTVKRGASLSQPARAAGKANRRAGRKAR